MPKFEREIEIDAPVQKVWEVLVNPTYWPQWFPGLDTVSSMTTIHENEKFEWTDEGRTGTGTVVKVEPGKYLEILTQMGNDKDQHVFKLRPSGGFLGLADDECTVKYILDTLMGGGILSNFVAGGNPRDAIRVKKAITNFRKIVENM